MNSTIIILAAVIGIMFDVYCIVDCCKSEVTSYLPKWAWIIICLISMPLGGILYLLFGNAKTGNNHYD